MSAARRTTWLFLLALPVWLGLAGAAAAQTLTADINGDGIPDRVEAGRTAGELLVQLSGRGPVQRLQTAGPVLDLAVADIDKDGDSDLVVATAGRRHIRLFVWTNAGGGHFVTRHHKRAGPSSWSSGTRLRTPADIPVADDLTGGPSRFGTLPALDLRLTATAGEPLQATDDGCASRLPGVRRAPRGPPARPLLS